VIPEKLIKFRVLSDESNISGVRPDVARRIRWVSIHSLKHYLKIKTAEEFLKVFPEAAKYKDIIEDDLVPYFLAQVALAAVKERLDYLGVDILFNMLADDLIAKKLEEKTGFTYNDMIKMTGKYDLFNIVKVEELEKELADRKKRWFRPF
jgi:hypothetical protein